MSYSPSAIRSAACRTLEYETEIANANKIYSLGKISDNSYYKILIALNNNFLANDTEVNGVIEFEIMGHEITTVKSTIKYTEEPLTESKISLGIYDTSTEEEEHTYEVLIKGIKGNDIQFNVEYTFEPFNYFSKAMEKADGVNYGLDEYICNKYIVNKPLKTTSAVSENMVLKNLTTENLNIETLKMGEWTFTVNNNVLYVNKEIPEE